MTDPMTLLAHVKRPALLMAAAREAAAAGGTPRTRALLNGAAPSGPAEALLRLLDIESAHEEARVARDVTYSVARHLDVLSALLREAAALRARTDCAVAPLRRVG